MQLYQDIRPPNAPKDGIPVEDGDPTFEPGVDFGQHYRTGRRHRTGRAGGAPFDPALQLDQLKHRAMVARSEAGMLNEALAFTAPDELEKNAIIQEFYKKGEEEKKKLHQCLIGVYVADVLLCASSCMAAIYRRPIAMGSSRGWKRASFRV